MKEWHSISPDDWQPQYLAHIVTAMLTEQVTRSLPTAWQGTYTVDRARDWIRERDNEGTTLLIVEKSAKQAVGLMILHETDAENLSKGVEVRLGYLLSEPAWGKGIASELIEGFVDWCRGQAAITSLAGEVELDNPASGRVLEKNGFRFVESQGEAFQNQQEFRLKLR